MTLKDLREENKRTVAEVAKSLDITVQAIYRYERGARRVSLEQVLQLAKLYDCPAEEVITAQLNSCQFDQ